LYSRDFGREADCTHNHSLIAVSTLWTSTVGLNGAKGSVRMIRFMKRILANARLAVGPVLISFAPFGREILQLTVARTQQWKFFRHFISPGLSAFQIGPGERSQYCECPDIAFRPALKLYRPSSGG
jgi:hypothetical protein